MKIVSGSASISLAEKIGKQLSVSISVADVHVFADGERRIRINESVVGEHVFVVQSTNTPVDTNYMELFFLIDALKRSGAEFVSAIVPYLGYQRQDHIFRDGEAVSLEVIRAIIEKMGADRLMSLDMHSVKIPDIFSIPVNHMSALSLFAKVIQEKKWERDSVLVSPDMGGIARIKKLAQLTNLPFISVEKNRDLATGRISMAGIEGNLAGAKRAILVDDMIASGQTIVLAAQTLKEKGVEEIHALATHAIFSEDAPNMLEKSLLQSVTVTDTVTIPKEKQFKKLSVLSVAPEIAQAIQAVL